MTEDQSLDPKDGCHLASVFCDWLTLIVMCHVRLCSVFWIEDPVAGWTHATTSGCVPCSGLYPVTYRVSVMQD